MTKNSCNSEIVKNKRVIAFTYIVLDMNKFGKFLAKPKIIVKCFSEVLRADTKGRNKINSLFSNGDAGYSEGGSFTFS